ncbi:MAG: Por secretion system protein, partial [Tannerella sp.]|nr:Por secretion system protein [Tannerella sp.]
MKKFFFFWGFLFLPFFAVAQVTTDPEVVTESGTVRVIFDAAKGNKGLQGYTGDVYAHTGVITDRSVNGSDWRYAPAWGDNREKYKLTPMGNDLWQLTIAPDIRAYYGVPETEKILKLVFVFRSGDT